MKYHCQICLNNAFSNRLQLDETYFDFDCTGTKRKSLTSNVDQSVRVKREPQTQQKQRKFVDATKDVRSFCGDSSSVFAVPNDTEEIITIEETCPMLLDDDDEGTTNDLDVHDRLPAQPKSEQSATDRTPQAAGSGQQQPEQAGGFMCPECGPVSRMI